MDPLDLRFPGLLRAARALAGVQASDLAAAAGIAPVTIKRIESGKAGLVRPSTQEAILRALASLEVEVFAASGDAGPGVRMAKRQGGSPRS